MTNTLRLSALALAAAIALPASSAMAQGPFSPGTKLVSAGLLSDGGTGFAGSFEYSLLQLAPKITLGIGGTVGYFSESSLGFSFSSTPILANGNVHIEIP